MHTTSPLVNKFFYILCNEGHFPEFTIIFPPLIPTINLVFPAFTFNPLSRMLALQSVTCLLSCSIVGAISNNSSTYNKWPLIQTRLPSLSPAFVRTTVDTMQAHPHPSSSKPISKPLSGQILLCMVFLFYVSHDEKDISGSLARHEAKTREDILEVGLATLHCRQDSC